MTIFEKEVTVLGVAPAIELATGDPISVVSLGEILDKTPQIAARLVPAQQESNKIPAYWMAFWIKSDKELPYRVGSKWKMSVSESGALNLVESK